MEQTERNSAYRDFRISAYRKKYDMALIYGGKSISFGVLLSRVEYAYNTFCQMGITPGKRVCLWLPNCPDLLASFYGLSRLGAIGVLIHPEDKPREVRRQMERTEAQLLITTAGRYEKFCAETEPLPPGQVVLCHPEQDMKRNEKQIYRELETPIEEENQGFLWEEMMKKNRYNALDIPFGDDTQDAVLLCGTSNFMNPRFITYLPEALANTAADFRQYKDRVQTVYVENSFATEGGFLAVHSALSSGKTVLWSIGEPYELLKKIKPDFLVATEEFFWEFRQRTAYFGKKWLNLQGGYQIGKPLTPLMKKFAGRAVAEVGGRGEITEPPVSLKVRDEDLYFVKDYGVRLNDLETAINELPGVKKCNCIADSSGLRLKIMPDGTVSVAVLGNTLAACCRRELNPAHSPRTVEFCASL